MYTSYENRNSFEFPNRFSTKFCLDLCRYTSTHDSLPGAPPPPGYHLHHHQHRLTSAPAPPPPPGPFLPHHHRPHYLMPNERETALLDEVYAHPGYMGYDPHLRYRSSHERPPPSYAVAVRSSRHRPSASATSTSASAAASTSSSSEQPSVR